MVTRKHTNETTWLEHPLLEKARNLSATDCLVEGIGIATILHEIGLDNEGLASAIIYPSLKAQEIHLDSVQDVLGENSSKLLKDVLQMGALGKLQHLEDRKSHQLENLRKMLLAMVADVRAVLVILAERLWLMRKKPSIIFSQETLDVYAPLANRLGVGQLKWELEDLCLRYLKPDEYKKIAAWLASKREERENYIQKVIKELNVVLNSANIHHFEVTGRVKHIYSIYKKMLKKKGNLDDIYDISAVRILVETITDCYTALGIVQEKWEQISKEFDDYIANPKPNGYRSIHTALIGPDKKIVEVQIRTKQMHQESELGVAAHWKYKEGAASKQSDYESKIAWLREIMAWQREITKNSHAEEPSEKKISQKDLFADRVYVFTPTGDIIDLPQGSTPLDFAYHIHSEVGHRCKGAKISGSIVPLTYHLQTGEQVEILTAKLAKPSRDWMNPNTGYLKTARARNKVQHWFKVQEEQSQEEIIIPKEKLPVDVIPTELPILKKASLKKSVQDIQILGVGHLLTQMAGCCRPLPGEDIIGYITQGKGVSIHKKNCKNITHINPTGKIRLIEVAWGETTSNVYPVDIQIIAYDRHGLLRDITAFFATEKINMLGIQTFTDKNSQEAHIKTTIEILSLDKLQKIIAHLKQIPNVLNVFRT